MRSLGLLAVALLASPAAALGPGIIVDPGDCGGVNLQFFVETALAEIELSADRDCLNSPLLRDLARKIERQDGVDKKLYIHCTKSPQEVPHVSCKAVGECDRPDMLYPPEDAHMFINPAFRGVGKDYRCPLVPNGDMIFAFGHEFGHAGQRITGTNDRTVQGNGVRASQLFADRMENILRRADGVCQRVDDERQSDKTHVAIDADIARECPCDPTGIDRLSPGPWTCADVTRTCCGRRCVDTRSDTAHCGMCDRACVGGTRCCASMCVALAGSCGPASRACTLLDAGTASSVLGRGIMSSEGQIRGAYDQCDYQGDRGDRPNRIISITLSVYTGVADRAALQAQAEATAASEPVREIADVGDAAYVIGEGERAYLSLLILKGTTLFTIGFFVQDGLSLLPGDALDLLVQAAGVVMSRL